ncbi:CD209 antigen [Merluccius polli]|uniref:CD209 antigen n=1 Tax=Merluccius polli TaxID=89951 RepID=A0AA47P1I6_MERPO|nr:CD209 antigen [Merluccius polli]
MIQLVIQLVIEMVIEIVIETVIEIVIELVIEIVIELKTPQGGPMDTIHELDSGLTEENGNKSFVSNVTVKREYGESTQQSWLYFNNSFYFISSTKKNWMDSRDDCLQRNTDLLVINSREEQELTMRWHGPGTFWIGLRETKGTWEWVDGTNMTLSYWGDGEPNHIKHHEDCVEIWDHHWFDRLCGDLKLWICEKVVHLGAEPNQAVYLSVITNGISKPVSVISKVYLLHSTDELTQQGWKYFNHSFYFFSATMKTWQGSKNDCQ